MVHNKDKYKTESYCPRCNITVKSTISVFDKYGYLETIKQPWKYPRVYDDKGKTYQLFTLVPIRQYVKRGLDGTLFREITEERFNVYCPQCGKQCRVGPLSKTKYNQVKKKTVHKIAKVGVDIDGKDKVVPIDSKVKLVKKTKEYYKSDNPVGRPKGQDKDKEKIEKWVKLFKISKDSPFEYNLQDVPKHLHKKLLRKLSKEMENGESK